MNLKRFRLVLIAVVLLSMMATYSALAWQQDPTNPLINQATTQVRPPETTRDAMLKTQLERVLRTLGVHVGEIPPETPDHKRLSIRWQSGTNGEKSLRAEQPAGLGVLTFTNSAPRSGAVPRPRNLELSTTHMLVIAVDEVQQLLWWNQFPDPRILRAEVPDANGQQHIGRTFYLTQTDFTVAYPHNPAIQELRFYHPNWTGKEFQLELIGSVSVK
jgi:hypothetical protein